MAHIAMRNISHRYPGETAGESPLALKPLNLAWENGGAYALLGPSGCGKTTLLNILSGLLNPSSGQVFFDGNDVTSLTPQARNIAQVFQFPVVYDTMTVAENLEFPLRNQHLPKRERKARVAEILALLNLEHLARERARNLGADDKQKVSLGRGLVRTNTNAVLFDEPLTVIDPALKWELRAQLKQVHQHTGHTMIYVTHDQTEALTFADKVVVMLEGEVLQVGTPQMLFEQPEHTFVGRFIGSPGMNIVPCAVSGHAAIVDGYRIPLKHEYSAPAAGLELGVRPEHVRLVERDASPEAIPVSITRLDDLGKQKVAHLQMGNQKLAAVLPERSAIPANPAAVFDANYTHLYQNARRVPPHSGGSRL